MAKKEQQGISVKSGAVRAKKVEARVARSTIDTVPTFRQTLRHPLNDTIEAVRRIILGAAPSITEGIKWNSPSFRTTEWFATVNLLGKDGEARVWLILHAGARASPNLQAEFARADPASLLMWLGTDRALIAFESVDDVTKKTKSLEAIVRKWILHV